MIIESRSKNRVTNKSNSQAEDETIKLHGEDAIAFLRLFSWLDFIGGIIGGAILWRKSEVLWGTVITMQGMFFCSFFLVVASIAENLLEIRKKIFTQESD